MASSDPTQPADDVPERFAVDFTGLLLLGTYRVERRIADGGMGGIYLGEDTNLGRPVVIKVPHVRFLGEPGFRARFRREIAELVRFEHPHIVRILAQGEHDDVPFFVLQYLGGGSLEDSLAAGPCPAEDVLRWLPAIAKTLDFVHGRGTVHRDVKPANILFDEAGHVFLSDFGVAKALEERDGHLTEAGTGIGSPVYMAPEQAVGTELTPAADQYALGCMVYEALAGRPPYEPRGLVDMMIAKRTEEPTPLLDVAPGVPPDAAAAVMRALARDPAERHASCRAFAEAVADGVRPPAGALPLERPTGRPRARRIAALVVLLAVGGIAFSVLGPRGSPSPRSGASNEVAELRLTLLDAGAEPRRTWRYAFRQGAVEDVRLDMESRMKMEDAQDSPADALPITTWNLRMTVEDVRPDGSAAVRWTTQSVELRYPPEAPPELRAAMERFVPHYRAFGCTAVLTPNGLVQDSRLELTREVPPLVGKEMKRLFWSVRNTAVPFPVEPVGPGARWEVTEGVDLGGIRLTHAMTHEMHGVEDGVARLVVYVKQVAVPQPMDMAGIADGMEARLLDLTTTGRGDTAADAAHLVPAFWNFAMTMRMQVEATLLDDEGKPTEDTAQTDMTMDMKVALTRK